MRRARLCKGGAGHRGACLDGRVATHAKASAPLRMVGRRSAPLRGDASLPEDRQAAKSRAFSPRDRGIRLNRRRSADSKRSLAVGRRDCGDVRVGEAAQRERPADALGRWPGTGRLGCWRCARGREVRSKIHVEASRRAPRRPRFFGDEGQTDSRVFRRVASLVASNGGRVQASHSGAHPKATRRRSGATRPVFRAEKSGHIERNWLRAGRGANSLARIAVVWLCKLGDAGKVVDAARPGPSRGVAEISGIVADHRTHGANAIPRSSLRRGSTSCV